MKSSSQDITQQETSCNRRQRSLRDGKQMKGDLNSPCSLPAVSRAQCRQWGPSPEGGGVPRGQDGWGSQGRVLERRELCRQVAPEAHRGSPSRLQRSTDQSRSEKEPSKAGEKPPRRMGAHGAGRQCLHSTARAENLVIQAVSE